MREESKVMDLTRDTDSNDSEDDYMLEASFTPLSRSCRNETPHKIEVDTNGKLVPGCKAFVSTEVAVMRLLGLNPT